MDLLSNIESTRPIERVSQAHNLGNTTDGLLIEVSRRRLNHCINYYPSYYLDLLYPLVSGQLVLQVLLWLEIDDSMNDMNVFGCDIKLRAKFPQ